MATAVQNDTDKKINYFIYTIVTLIWEKHSQKKKKNPL